MPVIYERLRNELRTYLDYLRLSNVMKRITMTLAWMVSRRLVFIKSFKKSDYSVLLIISTSASDFLRYLYKMTKLNKSLNEMQNKCHTHVWTPKVT